MKGLIKKVRENKKGFTLAELLVVVAIVGILVAISIPVFTAQLSKARKATNQANLRAAKAAAVAQYMTDEMDTNAKYSLQGTTQGRYLTGVAPVRLSTSFSISLSTWASSTCSAAIFWFAFAAFFLPVRVL